MTRTWTLPTPRGDSRMYPKRGSVWTYLNDTALNWASDECLLWPFGKKSKDGYGTFTRDGKTAYAHRWLCIQIHGKPPTPRHQAAHSCGNGHLGCVNWRHIRWATPLENHEDKNRHGRKRRGETIPWSKLTTDQVLEIKGLIGAKSLGAIAKMYGVSIGAINGIRRGTNWRWLNQ